ncbi:hypothetical protein [Pseudomonas asplenii]|uniref:hypothetical protein n=1 Tax=Pseudomonas asplenii TaxID=53407 RepID=UPI002234D756|nr:hypothetical protein [Pseudomonas asplenii]UZE30272.1 hypothetical protein LOY63_05920 [Pseudomonas asplenii]
MTKLGDSWIWFIYCALLFCAGGVFGCIFTTQGKIGFVSFLGALASLATVAAAITAVMALTLWKAQFQLQKKYDAVIDLRTFLHSATHPLIFLESYTTYLEDYVRSGDDRALSKNFPSEVQREWFTHSSSFGRSWDMMEVVLSDKELSIFSSDQKQIDNILKEAVKALSKLAFDGGRQGGEEQIERLLSLRPLFNKYANTIDATYSDLEAQSRMLLKKLAT